MTVRKIKNSWWVDFWFKHERNREKSPENSKAGAEAYEAVLRHKLARGESLVGPDKKEKEREQLFENFASEWLETYVKTNNKCSEANQKKYTLRTHLIPFFGKTPISKTTTLQIEQYKTKKIDEGLANKTINNHLIVLGTCLRTAQEWLGLEKIPKIKKLKLPPLKIEFLLQEECELLLAHSNGVWREIILMALKTGLRIGELRALSWPDIDWNNNTLNVRHSWCNCEKAPVAPKSNRARQIPLTFELRQMLEQRKQTKGFVFTGERGQMFSDQRLNQEISKACKKAGLREITCHTLRHTFASHLAMAGAPLKAIQELMGHANIQITMRYAHLAQSSLRETIGLLEPKRWTSVNFGQQVVNADNVFSVQR